MLREYQADVSSPPSLIAASVATAMTTTRWQLWSGILLAHNMSWFLPCYSGRHGPPSGPNIVTHHPRLGQDIEHSHQSVDISLCTLERLELVQYSPELRMQPPDALGTPRSPRPPPHDVPSKGATARFPRFPVHPQSTKLETAARAGFLTTQNSRDIGLVETPPRAKAVRGALPIRRLRRHSVRAASTAQHRRPTTASDSRTKSRLAVPGQPRSKQESSPFSRALTLM
ncbi:hypothetical protein B0T11DRAFT_297975 [Plectosphaerella cucumerina]|uniref:Uncharacterized protein n=1 Tax=Plectosphaerella cucumerina TaxID=40658 RepID=A0A8K0TI72_9PEZI|nr:hypothetical protein B0T11DRAFT_297975 [Plectosphaerella cucumerina]